MAALSKWVPVGDSTEKSENIMKPPKLTTIDKIGGIFCHICHVTFGNKKDFDSHYIKHSTGSTDFVYTCVQCRKEIVGYPSFRGHCYLQHIMKDKFKCEQCDKVFSKLCVLKTHVKAVHQYKCPTCKHEFQTQKQLAMHQILHKNDQNAPPYDCQNCGKQIDSTDECELHIEDHSHMSYSCPICDESIAEITDAASHLTQHFGDILINEPDVDESPEITNDSSIDLLGGIFCCHCEQIYKARPEFDNHFSLEHPDQPIVYACNICGKEYEKYFVFANHCYYHYSKGRFQCEVCFKPFPRLSLLVTHMEAYHADGREVAYPFSCLECDHGFKSQRRLKDHYRISHNIVYNRCPEKDCMKIFDTSKDLAIHLKEHKRTDTFCRTCGLRFSSLTACEKHLQVHRKKAYSCPVCSRSYGEKYLVMKHVNQHFSSVLHICNICGKVYNARSRLNNHMKVHNETREHTCSFCGKGFTKPYLLSQHINIHTGLKPYKCTVCPKTFACQPNLTKHLKCMHNINKIDLKLCYNPNFSTKTPNPRPNTKIERIKFETNEEVYDDSIEIPDNNNTGDVVEIIKNPTNETSSEVYAAHSFEETDDWKSDTIDPNVMKMLEENINNIDAINANNEDISELENALWAPSPSPMIPAVSASEYLLSPVESAYVPREYGPEFVNTGPGAELGPGGEYIHLDDHLLPHIDPRLTVTNPPGAPQAWEPPVFTKVYQEYPDLSDVRYSMLNTDIF